MSYYYSSCWTSFTFIVSFICGGVEAITFGCVEWGCGEVLLGADIWHMDKNFFILLLFPLYCLCGIFLDGWYLFGCKLRVYGLLGINCDLVHNRSFSSWFISSGLDWHILFTFLNKDAIHKDFCMWFNNAATYNNNPRHSQPQITCDQYMPF
jgi:hypothetical protein